MAKIFHESRGTVFHGGALLYAVTGYLLGLYGLFSANWLVNIGATVWLAHAMVIAAYMIHECGHNTVFRSNDLNAHLGRFLKLWGQSKGSK